uniref:SAM domain-containing protein n=1 Tax=Denticeps clupeoides TaxID=299321 RepID=A0AAY4ARK9_9TELE
MCSASLEFMACALLSPDPCFMVTPPCMSEADRFSLEALRHIHREMDDDQDGGIEVEESVEFIIEDMQQQQTNKHNHLHREDQHITVEELWKGWKSSEVHNWTQDEVLRWLKEFVELPQYERNFKEMHANGNTLPRIAGNEPSFMSVHLKIQDQQHKQKLKLKALDVVLFGPPTRPPHNWLKDLLLIISVVMGIGGCWFAQVQNKASKVHISKMMKDLESLQRAEQSLRDLQEQLERAQEEKRTVTVEKKNLEQKMRDEMQGAQEEANRLHVLKEGAVSELSRLRYAEEELEKVREALKKAEQDMQASWSVPESLQLWLQLTHEVEVQYYNVKKQGAEAHLATAKEEAEKIKKKRSSVLGTLHVAHSSSLDQIDQKILEAKNALVEVTACLRERLHRWQQIEWLCGFPIMKNAGLPSLTSTLYPDPNWMMKSRLSYPIGSGVDVTEDSMASLMPQIPVSTLKRSPCSMARSRRTGHIVAAPIMLPPDPDLLIPVRTPLQQYGDDEDDQVFIPQLTKPEFLDPSTDADNVVSSLSKKTPSAFLDTCPRRIFRDDLDSLSDSITQNKSWEELEASTLKRTAKDVPEDTGKSFSWKMSKDDLTMEMPRLKMSREELPKRMTTTKDECELSVDTSVKKAMVLDKMKIHMDVPVRKMPVEMVDSYKVPITAAGLGEELDVLFDTSRRRVFRERKNMSLDLAYRKISREEPDVLFDPQREVTPGERRGASRKASRDELSTYLDIPHAKMLRETEISLDKLPRRISRDEAEVSVGSQGRKLFQDNKQMSVDTASRRISRSEINSPTEVERRRHFRDAPSGRNTAERVGSTVELHRISRDEPTALDTGFCGQPDLTSSFLIAWKPKTDPLNMLVYDGILEKAYPSTKALPSSDIPVSIQDTSQDLEDLESMAQKSAQTPLNTPLLENKMAMGDKAKKPSKLKSLLKKIKDPSSSSEQLQGGLQKL